MDERIISYYLLCTAANGGIQHAVDALPRELFTKKEAETFFRVHEGNMMAHEHAIGGDGGSSNLNEGV